MENPVRIKELLYKEKMRRGVDVNDLVFVGMANVAGYKWCAWKSVLTNRKNEIGFFLAYLEDRLEFAFLLGFIRELPKRDEDLLTVIDEITFDDVEKVLDERIKRWRGGVPESGGLYSSLSASAYELEDGTKLLVVNPKAHPVEMEMLEDLARREGYLLIRSPEDLEKMELPPKLRGEALEFLLRTGRYVTFRWHFPWRDYVVVGVPDGITEELVYEFKTTRDKFLMRFIKYPALAQADLYGYFFKRGKKLVEIYVLKEDELYRFEDNVDHQNALDTLKSFYEVDHGAEPLPPKPWKCKSCEFRDTCDMRLRAGKSDVEAGGRQKGRRRRKK